MADTVNEAPDAGPEREPEDARPPYPVAQDPVAPARAPWEPPPDEWPPLGTVPPRLPVRPVAAPRKPETPAPPPPAATPSASPPASTVPEPVHIPRQSPAVTHVGDGPPTYAAEPTALPAAHPDALADLISDTVLDGARYGSYTLRAASVRGDSARYRGEPRRDALFTARFGEGASALVLVAVAGGARASDSAHLAAAAACRWIGGAVGRSQVRLSEDIRAGRRGDLKSGLHRLTGRGYGKLRARAAELGLEADEYTASLRCLLLSADPDCRTRVFFGVGEGGFFRLRDGVWQDLEPTPPGRSAAAGDAVVGFGSEPSETPDGDRLTMDLGVTGPPSPFAGSPHRRPASPFVSGPPSHAPETPCCCAARASRIRCAVNRPWPVSWPNAGDPPSRRASPRSSPMRRYGSRDTPTTVRPPRSGRRSRPRSAGRAP